MTTRERRLTDEQPSAAGEPEETMRQRAIKQIERRRRFHVELVTSGVGMLLLAAIWASTEFHNAGGWPTDGFSQSSGIPNVWNVWIIYPLIAWVLIMAARAWSVYGHRPISEEEIQREITRHSASTSG